MDWAKKNYDTLVLGVCTALLILNAAYLYLESSAFTESLPAVSTAAPSKSIATSPETHSLEEARSINETPVLWNEKSSSNNERGNLLVSRLYILKGDKLIDPIEGEEQLHPPITNAWLIKFGLNYSDANVKDQDRDGDGFTNLEEFNAKTDPTDKASTPSKLAKLRFDKFEQKPFPVIFKGDIGNEGTDLQFSNAKFAPSSALPPFKPDTILGIIDIAGVKYEVSSYKKKEYPVDLPPDEKNKYDEALAKIKAKEDQDPDLKKITDDTTEAREVLKKAQREFDALKKIKKSKDSLKKIEEEVGAAHSRIVDLRKSYDEKLRSYWHDVAPSFEKYLDTPQKDLSEVVLKNTLTRETITLTKDTPVADPNSVGVFFYIINNEQIRLKKGDEFTLKPDVNTKFKLIDISATEAKIQDIAAGTTTPLPKSSSPAH